MRWPSRDFSRRNLPRSLETSVNIYSCSCGYSFIAISLVEEKHCNPRFACSVTVYLSGEATAVLLWQVDFSSSANLFGYLLMYLSKRSLIYCNSNFISSALPYIKYSYLLVNSPVNLNFEENGDSDSMNISWFRSLEVTWTSASFLLVTGSSKPEYSFRHIEGSLTLVCN